MNKKEICKNSLTIALSYAFKGFEVKSIIQKNSNEIYAVSKMALCQMLGWDKKKKVKINSKYLV